MTDGPPTARWRARVDAAIAAGLLVTCAWLRPDVATGLLALGVVFVALERQWPLVEQRVLRPGWRTDVVHFVVDQVAAAALVAGLASVLVPWLEPLLPDLDTMVDSPLRLVAAAVVGEIAGYWGHRAMHRVPWLWRLHAIHHSSPLLDWLAPNRRHVLDTALGQAASVVPLLALGLSPPLVVSAFVARRAQGLFVHANLRIRLPGLRWIIATPEFHHWHHSADPAHHDRNFAGQCPILDRLFGTLHMPAGQWPTNYGLAPGAEPVPAGYLARLRWPFRDLRVRPLRTLRPVVASLAAVAVMSSTVVASAALTSNALPWNYRCSLAGAEGSITVAVETTGVTLGDPEHDLDVATVRHVEGDPSIGIGIRLITDGDTPMTISIAPAQIGSTTPASATSAAGSWTGTCTRRPDP